MNGTAATALSISNNNFQGIDYAAASTAANTFIYNTAPTLSQAINGNTFTNLNVNSSGNLTFISNNVAVSATGTQNINNNSILGVFTKAAGNTVTLFTSSAASQSGSVINNSNNNFSNITVTGATIIAGWVNTDAGASTKNIQNNTFSNWTGGTGSITALSANITGTNNATSGNIINNISSAGTITGIATAAGNDNIYSNIINTLSTTGAFPVNGIAVTAGTTKNIYKNKIYDLQAGTSALGTVNGILISGGTTVNVYNNLIGNLRTPAASAPDPIRGISVTSAVAPSTINVYYNTVYINAVSTGTNFGSTGIYHTTNATATTSSLDLRNNSITNTSTANGTGYTVAYRLSSSTLTNYAATSNNNMFYAGIPGVKKLLYWDGTAGDQTIAAYKTRVASRDAASVTEDITAKFLSTTGSSSVYLHMDSSIASVIKNGAVNITGYTDDIDGQIRFGNAGYSGAGTAPSIGADEIFGIENTPPAITYTALGNNTSATNRTVSGIIITDASGINNTPGTKPRIYYKRFSDANLWLDNTSSTNGWKYTEATNSTSPYTFTIDYSILFKGAAVAAGVIQYFIVAQDLATTSNIAVNSGTFAATPLSVALTPAAFPITGTINNYSIAFSGAYNVGNGEIYTSLTKSDGLFAAINNAGMMGNTTFYITSDLAEDGSNALNQWTESGVGNYTMNIQADAGTIRTISGNGTNGLIRLNGADRVTIDGSISGSGNYLSFKNTNAATLARTAITFINGATNNTIRYCNAEGSANATNGVILFGSSSVAGGNSNNLIDNCTVNASVLSNTGNVAIYSAGNAGNENRSNIISNNSISGYKDRGLDITASGSSLWTISGNSFYNGNVTGTVNYAASSSLQGIRVSGGSGYSILNNYIGGRAVTASGSNAVYSSTLGSVSYQGISLTTSSASPLSNIKGNTVAAISVSAVPTSAGSVVFTGIETAGSGINIGGSSSGEGNQIGNAANNSSIVINTATTSAGNTSFIKGINCTSTGGSIAGNQVAGFDINNTGAASASSSFTGVYINSASPPAQVINNIVGSRETSNSIRVLSTSTAVGTSLTGILTGSSVTSDMLINANLITNFSHLSLASSGSFTGISNGATSGTITISNDTIRNITTGINAGSGSTVYSGISSASACSVINNFINNFSINSTGINSQFTGINVSGAFAQTVSGNIISDITTASAKESSSVETGSPVASAVVGILNSATLAGQVISGNTIYNLNAVNSSGINLVVTGIGITATVSGNIYNNRIAAFTNQATGTNSGICGLTASNGSFNVYNNSIKIDNSSFSNGVKIYGINHASASNWNYFYNSVSIKGSSTGSALRSAAFIRPVAGTLLLRNNIFSNTRTGTGVNYAISNTVSPASSSWSASTADYKDLYSSNTNTIGEWGASTNKTFAQWQTITGGSAHSVSRPFTFIPSAYDLQTDSANCSLNNSGTPVTTPLAVSTDINNVTRNSVSPDIGAYEFNLVAFTASAANNSPVCAGTAVSFTSDPGIGVNTTYSWTNSANTVVSTVQNPNIIATAGTYTVKITDGNGCSATATTDITITPTPNASLSGSSSICFGNSATLSLTLGGSGNISGMLSSGDFFTGTASTITVNVSPAVTTSYFITSLSDANCTARASDRTDTAKVTVVAVGSWTGASSVNWNDPLNWLCAGVPSPGTDVSILAGSLFYPVITTVLPVNNLTIETGASLTINGTLQIAGTITNKGTLATSNGTVEFNGLNAQTIPANTFANNTIANLIISNDVALAGALHITGTLLFGNLNNKTFNTNGFLTLASGPTETARVGDITNGGINTGNSIIGDVTIERFIASKRAFRFLTAPVNATTTIRDNWMEGANNANTTAGNNNPFPDFGTHITGAGGHLNNFDETILNNPSLFTYNIQTQQWTAASNTNIILKAGQPYSILIRGSRSTNLNSNTAASSPTTLRAKGSLLTGTIILKSSGTGGTAGMPQLSTAINSFSFVANPYASPVDWLLVDLNNISGTMYIFDPAINGTNGRGGYVAFNRNIGLSGVNSNDSSKIDKNIQSGQAFFVKTTGVDPALTFKETYKTGINRQVFRTFGHIAKVSLQLLLQGQQFSGGVADAVSAYFSDSFTQGLSDEDSYKFTNQDENIAIVREGKTLSLEGRKPVSVCDTLPLKTWQLTSKNYILKIKLNNFESGVTGYLEDAFLHTSTRLENETAVMIPFSITSDTLSAAPQRFKIIFKKSNTVLSLPPFIQAYEKDKGVQVNWATEPGDNIDSCIVEKSVDGQHFVIASTIK